MITFLAEVAETSHDKANDSFDLAYIAIASFPAFVAAFATLWGQRKAKGRWRKAETTHEALLHEVKNDHTTNLRDDIDALHKAVTDSAAERRAENAAMREELVEVRKELLQERVERITGDQLRRSGK